MSPATPSKRVSGTPSSFRYRAIIGDRVDARSSSDQQTEAVVAGNILNRMTELGSPASYAIGDRAWRGGGSTGHTPIHAPTPAIDRPS